MSRRVVLVTGASLGIGAELARVFARKGHDLALAARSRDRLEALAEDIAAGGAPRPLVFEADLSRPGAADDLAARLAAAGAQVEILVNNAGFGLIGPAGLPADVVALLHREVTLALSGAEVRARLARAAIEPAEMTPVQFKQFIATEAIRWEKIVRDSGARID